jgi:hypothetical protein
VSKFDIAVIVFGVFGPVAGSCNLSIISPRAGRRNGFQSLLKMILIATAENKYTIAVRQQNKTKGRGRRFAGCERIAFARHALRRSHSESTPDS